MLSLAQDRWVLTSPNISPAYWQKELCLSLSITCVFCSKYTVFARVLPIGFKSTSAFGFVTSAEPAQLRTLVRAFAEPGSRLAKDTSESCEISGLEHLENGDLTLESVVSRLQGFSDYWQTSMLFVNAAYS